MFYENELIGKHSQWHGEWPQGLLLVYWGKARQPRSPKGKRKGAELSVFERGGRGRAHQSLAPDRRSQGKVPEPELRGIHVLPERYICKWVRKGTQAHWRRQKLQTQVVALVRKQSSEAPAPRSIHRGRPLQVFAHVGDHDPRQQDQQHAQGLLRQIKSSNITMQALASVTK